MIDLPRVRNFSFTINNQIFEFRDLRLANARLQRRIQEVQSNAIENLYPHELLCSSGSVRGRRLARVAGIEDAQERKREREKEDVINTQRVTLEQYYGERNPLTFTTTRDGGFFGSFQWYAMQVLSEDTESIRVSAGWFPAYPKNVSTQQVARLSIRMVAKFINARMRMEDGRFFDLVRAEGPLLDIQNRPDTNIVREAVMELSNHGFTVTRHPIPGAGRSRVTVEKA